MLENTQYEPEQFAGLIYREKEYTIIMFYSGKISSHGTTSELEANNAIFNTIHKISEINGIIGNSDITDIKIENLVAVSQLKNEIDIETISKDLNNCIYEPDQFPGLVYKPFNDSRTILFFESGKVVIVGLKSEDALSEIDNVLKEISSKDAFMRARV